MAKRDDDDRDDASKKLRPPDKPLRKDDDPKKQTAVPNDLPDPRRTHPSTGEPTVAQAPETTGTPTPETREASKISGITPNTANAPVRAPDERVKPPEERRGERP